MDPTPLDHLIQTAAEAISSATHLIIGAGAGCSADSGLKVFAQLNKDTADEGLTYDQLASSDFLAKNPHRSLGFWLAAPYLHASPGKTYEILSKWRASKVETNDFVLTSNVDGFFIKSLPERSSSVAQIHGAVSHWQCGGIVASSGAQSFIRWRSPRCCDELFEPPADDEVEWEGDGSGRKSLKGDLPRCPRCSEGILRPNVYFFGDGDRFAVLETTTREAAWREWTERTKHALKLDPASRLVILEIGCGLRVPSVRKRCEELFVSCKGIVYEGDGNSKAMGRRAPGRVEFIRINPDYPLQPILADGVPSIPLKMGALEALTLMDTRIGG